MAMGQEDKFPLWQGSVELAQTLMMSLGVYCPFVLAAGFNVLDRLGVTWDPEDLGEEDITLHAA